VLLIFLIGIFLFILSICSGRYLLFKSSFKLGLILSIINFALQIASFQIKGFGFGYNSGIELTAGFEHNFKFSASIITSQFNMLLNSESADSIFKINFAAIFLIWVLADIYDENFNKTDSVNEKVME